MNRILVLSSLCCALAVQAEEKKAAAMATDTGSKTAMTCGQMLKAKSVIPAAIGDTMVAVANYFDAHAADLAAVKSKEAKAEAAEMKKQAKMHRDGAKQLKAIATDLANQEKLAGPADHPAPSEKTKQAMMELLAKQKEVIALLQKDTDAAEKMMSESGAKMGGDR